MMFVVVLVTWFPPSPQNYTKAMRLFVGEPVWKAYNRPADDFDIRQKYVASLQGSWGVGKLLNQVDVESFQFIKTDRWNNGTASNRAHKNVFKLK